MADVDITSLSVEISAESQGAELNIDKLATAISNLRTKGSVGKVCTSLDKLSSSISALKQASAGISGLDKVTNFLNGISSVKTTAGVKGVKSVVNAIKKIPNAVSALNGVDFYSMSGSITQLTNALAPLSILDISGLKSLGSVFKAISTVPDLTDKLKAADLDSFADSCQKISTALAPLASQLDKVGNAFAKLPPQLSKVVTQANRVTAANERQKKSYMSLSSQMNSFMRSAAKLVSLKAIATYLGNAAEKFNSYYEAANLFGVSMKGLTGEASTFINKMETLLGIDPTEAMNNMATIQGLTTSFGMASDKAYVLSKNLTQLGYDLASLKNIPVAESFTKIQAAISGELEPIRRLGVDISNARLQQELLNLGYSQSVSTLSQADKAVLRYIAIMKQTTDAQGDFARTLSSPANMIRILQAQLNSLARTVGSLLYPALKSILPPLIAAVELVKELVTGIASLMGVKVEFPDFSSASDAVGGVTDAMDNTTKATGKAAKAFKNYIMGFDELNVIQKDKSSSKNSGSGAGAAGNILGDVDLSGYDMFKQYNEEFARQIDALKQKIKDMLPIIGAVTAALALWKIVDFLTDVATAISKMTDLQKLALSIATVVIEASLVFSFAKGYASSGNPLELLGEVVSAAFGSFVLWRTMGADGITLGMGIAFVASLAGLTYALGTGEANLGDASTWVQAALTTAFGSITGITLLTNLGVAAGTAATLSIGLAGLITFAGITFSLGEKLKEFPVLNTIIAALMGIFGGVAGAGVALLVGASLPVAGAVAAAGVGIGLVLHWAGIKWGAKESGEKTDAAAEADTKMHYVENVFEQRIEAIKQIIVTKWNAAIDFMTSLPGKVGNIINSIGEWFNSLPEKIGYALGFAVGKIGEWVGNMVTTVTTEVPKIVSSVVKFFEELPGNILTAILKTVDTISEWRERMVAFVVVEVPKIISSIVGEFKKLPDELRKLGKFIWDGLINGLKDAWSTVTNGIKSFTDGFINGFKDALGIHSPSKVFEQFGIYIDQGLANGISGAKELAENAMQKLSDSVIALGQQLTQDNYGMGDANIAMTANGDENSLEKTAISLRNVLSNVGGGLTDWLKKIKSAFTDFSDGINAVSDVGKKISQGFTDSIGALSNTSKSIVKTKDSFKSVFSDMKTYIKASKAEIENEYRYNGALSAVGLAIQKAFKGAYLAIKDVSTAVTDVSDTIDSVKNIIKTFNDLKTKVGEVIDQVPALKDAYNGLKTFFSNLFGTDSGIVKIVSNGWDLIKTKAGEALTFISGKIRALGVGGASGSSGGLASTLGAIGSTALPAGAGVLGAGAALGLGITGHVQWIKDLKNTWSDSGKSFGEKVFNTVNDTLTDIFNPFGAVIKIAKNKFGFAEGGFPDDGQLFLARESGPEFVGSMGGHTAVANNDQIVEGIREGVESAMAKQNELLRQQNELLKALLEKESTSEISVSSISQAISRVNQRNGKTIIPIGT